MSRITFASTDRFFRPPVGGAMRLGISLGITAMIDGCLSMQEPRTESEPSKTTPVQTAALETPKAEEEPADDKAPAERVSAMTKAEPMPATDAPPAPPPE